MFSFTSFKRIPIIGDLYIGEVIIINDLKNYDRVFSADSVEQSKIIPIKVTILSEFEFRKYVKLLKSKVSIITNLG